MIARLLVVLLFGLVIALPSWAEDKLLNVYNWSDYIAPDTVKNFEAATGIKVNYDVYDSNEVLEAKLEAGHSGYDVVVPTAMPYLAREAAAGVFLPIDKAKLKNYGNLDPQILAAAAHADPGNRYGVPYMWGTTGIGYNIAKVKAVLGDKAPVDSLKLLFDPDNAKKLAACGIEVLDSAQELFPAALLYAGRNPLGRGGEDIAKAVAVLTAIRPYIRKFHSSEYINDLANGDICVVFGYSGDVVQARTRAAEAKNNVQIAYSIPKEGAMIWIDMMAIPKDAPHPDNALAWIDNILNPRVAASISNTVAYANPNLRSIPFVLAAIRLDSGIYPPPHVRKRLFFDRPVTPEFERARTRAWTRVKTGS
ncbi:MAG TPA: polyamine ABC transporter substrate-binding protein [Stellaceae bacterium]|nr:polyamine ABC transporter substrate-binding protein [Stellaceae bacterium]